jgi:hypothetical protein
VQRNVRASAAFEWAAFRLLGETAMVVSTITTPQEYFAEVLEPNYRDFMSRASTFQTAFNVASSLFHMSEWIAASKLTEASAALGVALKDKYALWGEVQKAVPNAGYIRDVANASKHVKLHSPSTGMTHIANTFISSFGYGQGGYGVAGVYGGAREMRIKDNTGDVVFDDCAKDVYAFWSALIPKL